MVCLGAIQEALEVLRCSPRETELLVCRIPNDIADKMGLHPPESPASSGTSFDPSSSHSAHWLSPVLPLSALGVSGAGRFVSLQALSFISSAIFGWMPQEFEISMTKVNGSLGFTLRKEDESILGHYIRSLVKEPAISDGRIKPGDKIISVSDIVLLANNNIRFLPASSRMTGACAFMFFLFISFMISTGEQC